MEHVKRGSLYVPAWTPTREHGQPGKLLTTWDHATEQQDVSERDRGVPRR